MKENNEKKIISRCKLLKYSIDTLENMYIILFLIKILNIENNISNFIIHKIRILYLYMKLLALDILLLHYK